MKSAQPLGPAVRSLSPARFSTVRYQKLMTRNMRLTEMEPQTPLAATAGSSSFHLA